MTLSKEKRISLTNYLNQMTDKLKEVNNGDVPTKHKDSVNSYKLFLVREIESVNKKLDADKLERTSKD